MISDLLRQSGATVVTETDKILSIIDTLAHSGIPKGEQIAVIVRADGYSIVDARPILSGESSAKQTAQ